MHKYTSFSLNEFTFIGRLVAFHQGEGRAFIKVGTTEKFQNQQGEWQERDEIHHLTIFSQKTAEKVQGWAAGDVVHIQGRVKSWQDNDGETYKSGVVLKVISAKRIAKKQ